jgi:hypothetical protein
MPNSNVVGVDGRSSDDDESDVDELGGRFGGVGCVGHVGVFGDRSEKVNDGPGVIVGGCLQLVLGDVERLGSDGSERAVQFFEDLRDCALEESGVCPRQSGRRGNLRLW